MYNFYQIIRHYLYTFAHKKKVQVSLSWDLKNKIVCLDVSRFRVCKNNVSKLKLLL